jgi:hypothetical protein
MSDSYRQFGWWWWWWWAVEVLERVIKEQRVCGVAIQTEGSAKEKRFERIE